MSTSTFLEALKNVPDNEKAAFATRHFHEIHERQMLEIHERMENGRR